MPKFDREKFNSDPKHEEERTSFDSMVADSLERQKKKAEQNPPANPPKEKSFMEEFFEGVFGGGK